MGHNPDIITVLLNDGLRDRFGAALENRGFTVVDLLETHAGPHLPDTAACGERCIAVLDLSHSGSETASGHIQRLMPACRVIALADAVNKPDRARLLESGLVDLLRGADGVMLADHIEMLHELPPPSSGGCIIVFDDHETRRRLLGGIAERFSLRLVAVDTIADLLDHLERESPECVLLNLGVKGFDLAALIRRSLSEPSLKKAPMIAYKTLDEGIFIHELTSGLKKLCRVILSPEELYGLLVETLFRIELGRSIGAIMRASPPERLQPYATMSQRQAFRQFQGDIFPGGALATEEIAGEYLAQANALRGTLRRVRGLLWMVPEATNRPICGQGAGI